MSICREQIQTEVRAQIRSQIVIDSVELDQVWKQVGLNLMLPICREQIQTEVRAQIRSQIVIDSVELDQVWKQVGLNLMLPIYNKMHKRKAA